MFSFECFPAFIKPSAWRPSALLVKLLCITLLKSPFPNSFLLSGPKFYFANDQHSTFKLSSPPKQFPGSITYVNLSDQTANLTHETESFIFIVWKCFLAFNVQSIIRTDGWIQNLLNKYSNTMTKDRMSFYCCIFLNKFCIKPSVLMILCCTLKAKKYFQTININDSVSWVKFAVWSDRFTYW